jgi:uncharacterized protein (TIGR02453 family)
MTSGDRFAFPADTLEFLVDLRSHNDKVWFDANRRRYEASYLEPAKAFVVSVAPGLHAIVSGIVAEPRVLGSIFRINRDTRFSADKRPYKDHLDFWFWQGDRKTAVSGLFLRVSPDGVIVGAGAHGFDKRQLARYRNAIVDPAALHELDSVVARLDRAGLRLGGETYARAPRGFAADGPLAERLLRHSALYVQTELAATTAIQPGFASLARRGWRTCAPLHRWLVRHVQVG